MKLKGKISYGSKDSTRISMNGMNIYLRFTSQITAIYMWPKTPHTYIHTYIIPHPLSHIPPPLLFNSFIWLVRQKCENKWKMIPRKLFLPWRHNLSDSGT
ncbi:hypothetical protein CIPAW_06G077000 [Carya illinoinensis]|uniref:Uncharacterized protein n=1 Tax=Carya illinoinensis TaxID=32201 RepID=A0A8T1Q8Z9_CARIL|nr:hypothetical protein CIPAW_06G077000 [Carya illinoinensis]